MAHTRNHLQLELAPYQWSSNAMITLLRQLLLGSLIAALLAGCATLPERTEFTASDQAAARIAGFADIRVWSDAPAQVWLEWRARFEQDRSAAGTEAGGAGPLEMLAISSGSDKGAFSAGFLNGWSETGHRPDFDIVSGVSTGALIAPFAFLGEESDPDLKRLYTTIDASMVYRATPVSGVFGGPSLASTEPLAKLIETYADADLIDAVAREHRMGRRLLVQTTNLDAERGVVWDMGAIATSESPARYDLFRKILIASASIPGAFPPALIDIETPGGTFAELHVDGGTTSSVLAVPLSVILDRQPETGAGNGGGNRAGNGRLTILYNGTLQPVFRVSKPKTFAILERALTASIKASDQRAIKVLQEFAQERGVTVDIQSIGAEAEDPDAELFDQAFMQKLFGLGRKRALLVHGAAASAD
ncbi:MAG: patatin-like phospholipase family protein [Erythrobacter sp.]